MERNHRDTASKDLASSSWAEPEPCKPQKPPDTITAEDIARIPANNDITAHVRFLEAMNARYDNHPYFTAQLAMRMEDLGATAISASLLRQVFASLGSQTPSDDHFRPTNPWGASGSKTQFLTRV